MEVQLTIIVFIKVFQSLLNLTLRLSIHFRAAQQTPHYYVIDTTTCTIYITFILFHIHQCVAFKHTLTLACILSFMDDGLSAATVTVAQGGRYWKRTRECRGPAVELAE